MAVAHRGVRGLTVEDFEITERGQPQSITTFEAVDLPIERRLPDLADADVVTNEGEGRICLFQPGRYQLRIAVGTAQRGGSVIYDLDVPDFSKKELSMSGIALRGPNDPDGVFLPAGDPLQALAIRAPTTVRLFRDGDGGDPVSRSVPFRVR